MCDRHKDEPEGCRCHSGRVRGFVQPQVLLLLARKPAHGYELMEAIGQEDSDSTLDPGTLYRTLRFLEEDGVVRSRWDTEGAGPARRVYELTEQGGDYLKSWAVTIQRTRVRLDRLLADYESQFGQEKGG